MLREESVEKEATPLEAEKGDEKPHMDASTEVGEVKKEEGIEGVAGTEGEEKPEDTEPKKKIIVVDSNEKTLDATISALRKGEYSVIGVESTEEFFDVTRADKRKKEDPIKGVEGPTEYFELIEGNLPELIITDLDLKDLDGWEFIFRLKFDNRYYEFNGIPIFILTDVPVSVEVPKKIQAEHVHDYIPKTMKGEKLLEKVDKYFETRAKLAEKKNEIRGVVGHVTASEYERLSLAIRIRLKYVHALKKTLEQAEKEGREASEIKNLQEVIYLEKRNLIKYERRKGEIKRMVKVKKDERGAESKSDNK